VRPWSEKKRIERPVGVFRTKRRVPLKRKNWEKFSHKKSGRQWEGAHLDAISGLRNRTTETWIEGKVQFSTLRKREVSGKTGRIQENGGLRGY